MAVRNPEDRWDWTSSGEIHSPTRLGDHAAARYRRFRQTIEAIPHVNETLFGLLLTVESAREELQPYEAASVFVQLAGTNVAVDQLKRLHHVLDEAVIMSNGVLQSMDKTEWMGALEQERIDRIEWYREMLDAGKLDHEVATAVQQEEVLTLLKAAVKEDETIKELMEDERELMEIVFDRVVASTGMVAVSIPDWFVMPLSLVSSFGLSSWGSQRLEVESGDSEKVIRSSSSWSTLNHPNVAKFLGACFVGDRPFMVHESVRPLVFTLTDRKERPERKYMWKCMHEIALGLRYLHNHGLAIANFTPDSMWRARFEGKAVVGCGDVLRVEHESGLDMRAFATSIVNVWREVDVYHRDLNTFFFPSEPETTQVENQEFPAKCPKFLVKREWELLKRMALSGADFQFVTDRMSELAELNTKDRVISIEKQMQDTKLAVDDIIMPTREMSIGECLELCKNDVIGNMLGAQVCDRIADVLTQLKVAQKTRDLQSSSAAEVVATYCWCLDRLFNLMRNPGGTSLSLSASASVSSAFEKDMDEIHEKLDHLIESHEILQSDTIHAWTAKVTLEPIAEQLTPSRWFILPDKVHIEQELKSGSFATAWRGKWFDTPVVVRRLNAPDLTQEMRAQFISEADIWFRLNHVNVVKMYGACDAEPPLFVCEYAGYGQLKDFLNKYCRANPSAIWYCLLNAALGLQYLHRVGIVHGDLKLNNILVGNDGIAKLADFGLSLDVHDGNSSSEGARGAFMWKAPECLPSGNEPGRQATFASDIFSFAMCMIEAVSGKLPWGTVDDAVVEYNVKQGKIPQRPDAMEEAKWNSQWSLIQRMTCLDPAQRVTIDAVVANLYAFIMSLDMGRLNQSHGVLIYDNEVIG